MTDLQSDIYKMLKVLSAFLTKFAAIVAIIPAFKRHAEKLEVLIADIASADSGRPSITAGKTEVKSNVKELLAAAVYNLALSLATYADEHKKPEITERVGHTENYYFKMRDANLPLEAADLVKLTTGIEAELLDHGLTAEQIAEVTALSKEFEESIENQGASEAKGSSATKSVYQLIGEAQNLVKKQLTPHAEKFRKSHPDFYTQYLSASRVVEHPGKQKKDDGNSNNSANKEGGTTTPPTDPNAGK